MRPGENCMEASLTPKSGLLVSSESLTLLVSTSFLVASLREDDVDMDVGGGAWELKQTTFNNHYITDLERETFAVQRRPHEWRRVTISPMQYATGPDSEQLESCGNGNRASFLCLYE